MSVVYILHITDMTQPVTDKMLAKLTPERISRMRRYKQHSDRMLCAFSGALAKYAAEDHFGVRGGKVQVFMPRGMPPYAVYNGKLCYMSISHTSCYVMGMTDSMNCGADIECINDCIDTQQLADRYFCNKEALWIRGAETADIKAERFARLWTAKEAYLKYCGEGLRRRLDSFCISAEEDDLYVTDPLMPKKKLYSLIGKTGGTIYTAFSETPVKSVRCISSNVLF